MKSLIGLIMTFGVILLLSATDPVQAQQQRWCLRAQGAADCSFDTLDQCKATRGPGGYGTCFRARRPQTTNRDSTPVQRAPVQRTQAATQQQRWCLRGYGAADCSFDTLNQCKESRGPGGYGTCFRAKRQQVNTP